MQLRPVHALIATMLATAMPAAQDAAAQDAAAQDAAAQDMAHGMAMPTPAAVPVTRRVEVPRGATGVALPELGVEIIAVRLSAAGGMLDLRYRVLDPARAKPLMDPAVPISLIDASGAELRIPVDEQVGSLRQSGTKIRAGQVLANLFDNPGRAVRKGGKITLRLGALEVVGLIVEG